MINDTFPDKLRCSKFDTYLVQNIYKKIDIKTDLLIVC